MNESSETEIINPPLSIPYEAEGGRGKRPVIEAEKETSTIAIAISFQIYGSLNNRNEVPRLVWRPSIEYGIGCFNLTSASDSKPNDKLDSAQSF